ncbi:hypothetical protein G3569_16230 [Aliifodinibius halophilus]|uniref:Uncharacterized protein n=2 Tax=Fodinibius halophilus TaxID=1736908 RepID=A0A6M1T1F5_9BACT|nr:hypothetical protein [Fodinibius halophilus]
MFLGATCNGIIALSHIGCIIFGEAWYRFLGAGEKMAQMAEKGMAYPTVITSIITVIFIIWMLYALSGTGLIPKLPLLRTGLSIITAIYIGRGIFFFLLMPYFPGNSILFWIVSSAICLIIGIIHLLGLTQL